MNIKAILGVLATITFLAQADGDHLSYRMYAENLDASWQSIDTAGRRRKLIHQIQEACKKIADNDKDFFSKRDVIFAYNYLRDLLNLKRSHSYYEMDREWLSQQEFLVWKEIKTEEWRLKSIISSEQKLSDLGSQILQSLNQLESIIKKNGTIQSSSSTSPVLCINSLKELDSFASPRQRLMIQGILCAYNCARELANKPLAKSLIDIDLEWLESLSIVSIVKSSIHFSSYIVAAIIMTTSMLMFSRCKLY